MPDIHQMRILVSLVCIGFLLVLLHVAAEVVTPLLLGATLAIAFQPITVGLGRRGVHPIAAALVTTSIVLAVVAAAGGLIYVAASDLAEKLPEYRDRVEGLQRGLASWFDARDMHDAARSVRRYDPDDDLERFLESSLFRAGTFLNGLFFVLVITAFIQLEAAIYREKFVLAFGGTRSIHWLDGGLREVQRYLTVKLVVSLANGVLLGLWCWAWGVDSPLLWGVLAFALNFVPVIGSILAAIPPILLSLISGGVLDAIGVASGYLMVNLVVDNILEPRVLGRTLGLSPLVVLLSMLVWGFVLGPVGAILSVPLTMAARILFEHDDDLRPLAMMMSDGSELRRTPTAAMS